MPSCHACTAMIPPPDPWTALPAGWAVRGDRYLHSCPQHTDEMPCGGGPTPVLQSEAQEIPDPGPWWPSVSQLLALMAKVLVAMLLVLWIFVLGTKVHPLAGTGLVLVLWFGSEWLRRHKTGRPAAHQ